MIQWRVVQEHAPRAGTFMKYRLLSFIVAPALAPAKMKLEIRYGVMKFSWFEVYEYYDINFLISFSDDRAFGFSIYGEQ
jgi:hypothetical protein